MTELTNNAPVSFGNQASRLARKLFPAIVFACVFITHAMAIEQPWILLDANTGEVYSHNKAELPWHPASITKLMTVYTVFKEIRAGHIDLASPVKITPRALAAPPSKMAFPVGTILNIDNALKILMVKSANDIAIAIAQSSSGTLEKFVAKMNLNAIRLGMKRTLFTNPHGLHSPRQVTTAKDMAILTLALQREFPQYAGYFNISAIRFGKRRMRNHNKLIFKFPGTNGMKTGYTCASGLNIVARAKRGGKEFIAVILGGYSSAQRNILTAKLLQGAFDDRFNGEPRPTLKKIKAHFHQYAIPQNLKPMICKPSWSERQMSRKKRREVRRKHIAAINLQIKKHLNGSNQIGPTINIQLGAAIGANPYHYKLTNGGMPQITAVPNWRPDPTTTPYE